MSVSSDPGSRVLPTRQIIGRGFAAAHGALLGALFLFLLQAPLQVLGAGSQAFWAKWTPPPGQQADATYGLLALAYGLGTCLLTAAVLFLFPLVQGGILGQVHDRIESPLRPPGSFGTYARRYYMRLLGSQGLCLLVGMAIMVPVMVLSMSRAFQELEELAGPVSAGPDAVNPPPNPQEFQRQFLTSPGILTAMVIASLLMSAITMVYWIANCIVVSERQRVFTAWRKALCFCRDNLSAVLAVWLLAFAAGIVMTPFALAGQLGFVSDPWILAGMALVYAALLGYWGVLLAGLSMSLYRGREAPSPRREPALAAKD
jgi:hypothetical protein